MSQTIIILGGGLKDARQLSASTQSRLDTALAQYQGQVLMVVGAGPTQSPPPLDSQGFPVFESVSAVRYLLERGIPVDHVLYETSSYDTIGNAYFSRFIHVDPGQFDHLRVITSDFHLPRTQKVFDWIYQLNPSRPYTIKYQAAPDNHFDPDIIKLLKAKENQRLSQLQPLIDSITSIDQLHHWMFTQHAAYCAHLQPIKIISSQADKDLLLES